MVVGGGSSVSEGPSLVQASRSAAPSPAPSAAATPSRPQTSPLLPRERSRSPGPIYDTSQNMLHRSFHSAAGRGGVMGLPSGKREGVVVAGGAPGPGAYDIPRIPTPLPTRPADMGPPPENLFGTGRRVEMGPPAATHELYAPQMPWAFEKSFNAKALPPMATGNSSRA